MQRTIEIVSVLGCLAVAGLTACVVEDQGRELGGERGVWQSGGKADETATCAGACGAQAAAGCWCDEQCAEYGDCCPDKQAACESAAAAPAASGDPGAPLGTFELTYYWIADEASYAGSDSVSLYDSACNVLAKVPQGFANAIELEGTGRLTDGRVLNYSGPCGCASSPCYFEVDDDHPWGVGVQNRALAPFRSVAVDKSVVAYGSKLYIQELDGVTMPGEAPWGAFVHDGCVSADDTGSAIIGKHLDFFSARKADYLSLDAVLGVSHVTVREGGERCSGGGGGGGAPAAPPAGTGGELCFPGATGAGTTCVPLVDASVVGSGYTYPAPLSGNANYRAPIRYIDLEAVGDVPIAPNFTLSEVAQAYKGRYAVVQPHAIARLQKLRNDLGALTINSGYRSPGYNASVDGASSSRHMYGDGFDIDPVSASLSTLEAACTDEGGQLVEYTSHVHCDWRYDPVDTLLFGSLARGGEPGLGLTTSPWRATLELHEGRYHAPAEGFDEGEPLRRWTARNAEGEVIAQSIGESFVPPAEAASLEVLVGAQVELGTDLH